MSEERRELAKLRASVDTYECEIDISLTFQELEYLQDAVWSKRLSIRGSLIHYRDRKDWNMANRYRREYEKYAKLLERLNAIEKIVLMRGD